MASPRVQDFFDTFTDFEFDEDESATDEFFRLANHRGWQPNSKNWCRRWLACFGSPYQQAEDDYFSSFPDFLYNGVESIEQNFARLAVENDWQTGSRLYRDERAGCMAAFFASHYGSSADKLAEWQKLCEDASIFPVPPSITKCKKALSNRRLFINLVDMVQYRQDKKEYDRREVTGELQAHEQPPPLPRRFNSHAAFIKYTKKKGKKFPRAAAKNIGFLKVLLRDVFL